MAEMVNNDRKSLGERLQYMLDTCYCRHKDSSSERVPADLYIFEMMSSRNLRIAASLIGGAASDAFTDNAYMFAGSTSSSGKGKKSDTPESGFVSDAKLRIKRIAIDMAKMMFITGFAVVKRLPMERLDEHVVKSGNAEESDNEDDRDASSDEEEEEEEEDYRSDSDSDGDESRNKRKVSISQAALERKQRRRLHRLIPEYVECTMAHLENVTVRDFGRSPRTTRGKETRNLTYHHFLENPVLLRYFYSSGLTRTVHTCATRILRRTVFQHVLKVSTPTTAMLGNLSAGPDDADDIRQDNIEEALHTRRLLQQLDQEEEKELRERGEGEKDVLRDPVVEYYMGRAATCTAMASASCRVASSGCRATGSRRLAPGASMPS